VLFSKLNGLSISNRSSIGNTLYVVANMAAGGKSTGVIDVQGKKNYADVKLNYFLLSFSGRGLESVCFL
jgi:hypothetical protein